MPTAAIPVFSPAPGPQSAPILLSMTSKTSGAKIYYTLDGSMPTIASALYSKPISLSTTMVVQAIAVAPAQANSTVAQGIYLFGTPGSVFTINSGFTASSFSLNGSAKVTAQRLRILDGNGFEAGSAYFNTPVPITNFTTNFNLLLTNASADGMTFVIQNQGKTALGGIGGELGYGPSASPGISPSAALKFDLYDNAGEGYDSTGLYTGGVAPTIPAIDLSSTGIDLHSGHVFSVALSYNGSQLQQTITDTLTKVSFTHAYTVNLPLTLGANTALVGFTGGTGGLAATADVLNWSWSVPPVENFPASSLPAATSASAPVLQPYSNAGFPGGKGVLFPAVASGQSVSFSVKVATTATFAVSLLADSGPNRGIYQLSIDGKNFGTAVDNYTASSAPLNASYGSILLTAGTHSFAFNVTGKNKAATGYQASFGQITLTP